MVGEMCVPGINGVCSYSLEVHSSADNFVPMMTKKKRNSVATNFGNSASFTLKGLIGFCQLYATSILSIDLK